MSGLINTHDNRATIRWKLLTGASALALTAYVSSIGIARAEDADRPTIWVELGGGLERLDNPQVEYDPPFMSLVTEPKLQKALDVQSPPAYGFGENAKISYQPQGSDWIFAASIRYGRSQANHKNTHYTKNALVPVHFTSVVGAKHKYYNYNFYPNQRAKFANGQSQQSESHSIIDFMAGKDVGLGLLGNSVVNAGVRFAQIGSQSNVTLRALPDLQYPAPPTITNKAALLAFKNNSIVDFHAFNASQDAERSFHGAGPTLSWDGSTPFVGNAERGDGELSLDWGVNAAVLFGRQTAKGHYQTRVQTYHMTKWRNDKGVPAVAGEKLGDFYNRGEQKPDPYDHYIRGDYYTADAIGTHTNGQPFNRSRRITVPDLGATIGMSYRYQNAKISFGYRADIFFNAIDGGIGTRKNENRAFYGPYASISIGFGGSDN